MQTRTLIFISATFLVGTASAVYAGKSEAESGALVCVTDKWTETEPEKGHKLADSVQRCVVVRDKPDELTYLQQCTAKYEYLPDGSWKSKGECTNTYKSGDKSYETFEEGSHLKEYTYKKNGGTGKFENVGGGGTYMYEAVTDTLFGGRFKGTIEWK